MMKPSLPIMIFTGFLGSGKTTLLNKVLKFPALSNTLVIVNEFGEVPLDHLVLKQSGETVFELANGCACCSVRGALIDTLLSIKDRNCSRVFVETTGLADPLPIMQSLAAHAELNARYHLHSMTSVFDCTNGDSLLQRYPEAARQIALADYVYVTKSETLGTSVKSKAFAYSSYNSNAKAFTDAELDQFVEELLKQNTAPLPASSFQANSPEHAAAFDSIVLELGQPQSIAEIDRFVRHLAGRFGGKLLRLKGFAKIPQKPEKRLIVQMSGGVLHEPFEIDEPMGTSPPVQLIAIMETGTKQEVREVFEAFSRNPGIDRPDREALLDNPLSVPGFSATNG